MEQTFLTHRYSKGHVKIDNDILFYDCVDNICKMKMCVEYNDKNNKTKIINCEYEYECSKYALFTPLKF